MSAPDFRRSLEKHGPPAEFTPALQALWWAAKDDWTTAHGIVMANDDADCAWVHAHLHRIEGDLDNAHYWYRTAGRRPATGDLAAEREAIIAVLTANAAPKPGPSQA